MRYETTNGCSFFTVKMNELRREMRWRKILYFMAQHRILFFLLLFFAFVSWPFRSKKTISILATVGLSPLVAQAIA